MEKLVENPEFGCKYLVKMALNQKVSWTTLRIFLIDITKTFETSRQLNDVLLEELEFLHSKVIENQINEKNIENDVTGEQQDILENTSDSGDISFEENYATKVESQVFQLEEDLDAFNDKDIPEDVEDVQENIALPENEIETELSLSAHDSLDEKLDVKEIEQCLNEKRKYPCRTCGKLFTQPCHRQIHERIHSGEKPYQCKYCNKAFSTSGNLKQHERIIHSSKKPFKCEFCYKKFALKQYLESHERVHTKEKPYQCKNCLKKFTQKNTLTYHNRIHTGDKPYECKTCNKKFSYLSNKKQHEQIHHKK